MKRNYDKNAYVFESTHEKTLYEDLVDFLINHYYKKTDARRLIHNIQWFMNDGRGGFFAGFLFDITGTLSCWGVYEGGQDKDKYGLYTEFMKSEYDALALTGKVPDEGSLVPFAIVKAYREIMKNCETKGLVTKTA